MTENTATENKTQETQEVKTPTPEELKKLFSELPGEFQKAINDLNSEIEGHNSKVQSILAADAKDPKLIKAEIFEQNPGNNKKLAALRAQELKLIAQLEKLRDEAYKVIDEDGLMPKELSETEIEKLKGEVTDSTKDLREKVSALLKFEEMMPIFAGKFSPHISEIKTRRGAAKTGTSTGKTGEGPKRIRFKKIEVNGLTQDAQGNTVSQKVAGEDKYTFTFASQYLKKQHKSINWTAKDLTDAYLKGLDENNLPEAHEFVMPHTYKDSAGNEHTVEYKVKAYR